MCLMLYIATDHEVPEQTLGPLTVAAVRDDLKAKLDASFTKLHRRFVGIDGGCSCDFPHIFSEEPVAYYDGMFDCNSEQERSHAAVCVRRLVDLIKSSLQSIGSPASQAVELLPAWAGDEGLPPKGRIELCTQDVVPEQFGFVERFLYLIRDGSRSRAATR